MMKSCRKCGGTGLLNVDRPPTSSIIEQMFTERPKPELCLCITDELGALRAALVAAGLLPADHWTRGLPPRGLTGSIPPERSMVVVSTRVDGYRVISYGAEHSETGLYRLEALAPDGSVLRDNDQPLWWARVQDAERSIDRSFPLEVGS